MISQIQIQSSSSPTHSYSTSSPTKSSSSDPATPPKHKTTPTSSSHAHHNNPYIQTGKIVNNQQQYSHNHSHIEPSQEGVIPPEFRTSYHHQSHSTSSKSFSPVS